MNRSSTTTWSPMVSGPEEDFANFLEFGDLHLNFPAFDPQVQHGGDEQRNRDHGLDAAMEVEMGMMGMKGDMQHAVDPNLMPIQTSMAELQHALHGSTESLLDMDMQAQLFHQQQLQYHQQRRMHGLYHRHGVVPLTPTSLELHGQPRSYPQLDPQARTMYEHYARKQHDHMNFTPLVSPAVTPLDTHFRLPEYTIPGEYFSPLTSPALEAQARPVPRSVYGTLRGSDTSDTQSPVEMDIDQNPNLATTQGVPAPRKSKRSSTATSRKGTGRAVKESPAMKPQTRKKQPSSTVIPPKEVAELIDEAQRSKEHGFSQSGRGKLSLPYRRDSSEADSVSPEPLSEILMPPPATPRAGSVARSPYLKAQQNGQQAGRQSGSEPQSGSQNPPSSTRSTRNAPATPASLMKIQKPQNHSTSSASERHALQQSNARAEAELEQIMEGIFMPEIEAASKPTLPTLQTQHLGEDQATPTLSANKYPTSASTPVTTSAFASPHFSAVASPGGSISSKRGDRHGGGRAGKKRSSISSSQVSPALRPRISPSIKPLLPEGTTINAETSALLLASKSNYQNILEGTHLPGVSYPEALSTNLTSKRTSHKIAEQGRRNRINNALQEIASLLPSSTPQLNGMGGRAGSVDAGSNGVTGGAGVGSILTGTAAQQSNSKASTVEMAIEYIKSLQTELKDVRGRLEDAEKRLGAGGSAVGSPAPAVQA